ncbi:MAG: Acyltransferase family protein [Lentisphaerae bacterium ADurb.Bin242]|nr:MAG: Acyltransferase family protein [Lentisphaerae bacterium ADurb.Bin242]
MEWKTMTVPEKKFDSSVADLKALLLFGVVVNHAWAASQYIVTPQWPPMPVWNFFSNVLIISGLPVFFFLSGYFAPTESFSFFSPEYRKLLRKKFSGLFIPYLLWNALFIVLFLLAARFFPRIGARVESFQLENVSGILCSLLGIGRRPIDAPLWFIRDLMLIFAVLPVWNFLLEKGSYWFLAGLYLIGVFIAPVTDFYPNYYSICVFCLGLFCRRKQFDLHCFEPHAWAGIAALFLMSLALFWFPMKLGTVRAPAGLMCIFGTLVIPCWLGLMRFRHSGWYRRNVTPSAFFIYAAHFLVCSAFLHLVAPRVPDFPWKMAVLYLVFLAAGCGVLLAGFHFLRRFTPRLLGVLVGGRADA